MNDIYGPQEYFWFGKYRDQKIADVMRLDPGYIRWCLKSGALTKEQIPKAVEKDYEKREQVFDEFEDNLGEYFGDRDVPHAVSRTLSSAEVAALDPQYDVHQLSYQSLTDAIIGWQEFDRAQKARAHQNQRVAPRRYKRR
jgi:hypothetical protein